MGSGDVCSEWWNVWPGVFICKLALVMNVCFNVLALDLKKKKNQGG